MSYSHPEISVARGQRFPLAAADDAAPSMPESESALRNLKASESARLAFAAAGISDPPPALLNLVSDYVRQQTLGIPTGQVSAMAPGSGQLAMAAATGVNMAVSAMSAEQREAIRLGAPIGPGGVAAAQAGLNQPGAAGQNPAMRGMGDGAASGSRDAAPSTSGARYDGVEGTAQPGNPAYWTTPQGLNYMRSYAIQQGLSWAANRPELLGMGPGAVKALADVHLQKQSYDRLRKDAAFAPKDVVTLAKFAKEKGVDANNLSASIADFYRGLSPEEKARLNGSIVPRMAKPDSEELQKKAADAIDDAVRHHPEKRAQGERLKRHLKIKSEELHNEKKVEATEQQRASAEQQKATDARQNELAEKNQKQGNEKGAEDALAAFNDSPTGESPKKAAKETSTETKKNTKVAEAATGKKLAPPTGNPSSDHKNNEASRPKQVAQAKPSTPKLSS